MLFLVLIEDPYGRCYCRELAYSELLIELEKLARMCIEDDLSGFGIQFLDDKTLKEVLGYESQGSEDT